MTDGTVIQPFHQRTRLVIVKFLAAAAIATLLVSAPAWKHVPLLHQALEAAGMLLVLICMFGRLWCTLYVGSRKNAELVTIGPYSVTRNPLYFFSTIGVVGLGLVFGSLVVAVAMAAISYVVFDITARKEAAFLRQEFAAQYRAYEKKTPQFFPDVRLYHSPAEIKVSLNVLARSFGDSLYFLGIIALINVVEYVQAIGYMPVYLHIP